MTQSTLSAHELELYRLLEHAKLGQYFTNFLIKGGDDVSQLVEASKEEFDEIIDMVGMMQKPLHIRRLQKSLKEWTKDPNTILSLDTEIIVPPSAKGYLKANQNLVPRDRFQKNSAFNSNSDDMHTTSNNIFMSQPLLAFPDDDKESNYMNGGCLNLNMMNLPPLFNNHVFPSPNNGRVKPIELSNGIPVSMLPNAVLSNYEKSKIRLAAENLAHTLPVIETRLSSTGRKDVNKGVMNILSMPKDDPQREKQIYNYSAIYGRFNAPRRTGKPMNHHEVSVNEAAAQLSLQIPELITRRDNLFHLARQVVKMAEEIQDDNFSASKLENRKEGQAVLEAMQLNDMEKQISDIKNEIGHYLLQESSIRDSYREAKQNNQGLLMNELQKRLDDTLNHLNNKFTEQTSLATKIMLIKAGSLFGEPSKNKDCGIIKAEAIWPINVDNEQPVPSILSFQSLEEDSNFEIDHKVMN